MWYCKKCNGTKFNQSIISSLQYVGCLFDKNGYSLSWYTEKSEDVMAVIECDKCKNKGVIISEIANFKNIFK